MDSIDEDLQESFRKQEQDRKNLKSAITRATSSLKKLHNMNPNFAVPKKRPGSKKRNNNPYLLQNLVFGPNDQSRNLQAGLEYIKNMSSYVNDDQEINGSPIKKANSFINSNYSNYAGKTDRNSNRFTTKHLRIRPSNSNQLLNQ